MRPLLLSILLAASSDLTAQESSRLAPDADPDGVLAVHASRSFGYEREPPSIGMRLLLQVDGVNRLIDQNALQAALAELKEMANWSGLLPFEVAVIDDLTGFVYGRMNEKELAITHYEAALDSGELTPFMHQVALYSLAHLYASKSDHVRSIELMIEWFQLEPKPFADAFMFMGSNYAALERYEVALPWLEKAIELAERPIEGWYQVTYSIYIELGQYDKAIPMLKSMIGYWSQVPEYWQALAALYQETGEDRAAYDATMTAYINGMLRSEQSILTLVDMSLVYDTPYAAGSILENEMLAGAIDEREGTLVLLIDIWTAAREYDRALATIDKLADYSDQGPNYMRAARLAVQSGDFEVAAESAEKALAAGIDDRVAALVVAGSAYAELGRWDQSTAAFREVVDIGNEDERDNAGNWIRYVEESRQLRL